MTKHTLVSIGWLGSKRVYLDVSLDEAKERYQKSDGYVDDMSLVPIEMYEIDDEFWAYELGSGDSETARRILP